MKFLQNLNKLQKYIFLIILCAGVLYPVYAQAAEADSDVEVTIYGLNSSYLEKITIPDSMPQSHQLTVGDGTDVVYSISSGSSAKVSADGLITPKYTYWKRNNGFSVSVPEGEDYDYYTMSAGDTEIIAKTANQSCTVTVHVKDYAIAYCDGIMDAYLSENVKEGMTDYEIMEAVAKFPASYDYSASYSGVYSMILYGGGDCWASTSAIITLCDKLGIKAWSRNGNKDMGAGSGHMNAMAELNGVYYVLEAGYSMSKNDQGYRPYDVTVRESLFSFYSSSNGLRIYQYDGYDTAGVLEIPQTINGKAVTEICESAFSGVKFSEIKLPDTLTNIGDFAFSGCSNLTSIEIPASVTSIGASVFASCMELADLSIASGSASYQVIDQAIYSKDGKTLVTCPSASRITIPDTVTRIEEYAFYYNTNLQHITIPESVTEMGEGAFGNCSGLSGITIEGNGLTTIGSYCFRSDSSLSIVRIPASVEILGTYAFSYCSDLKHIYFMGDAPVFGGTIEGIFYDKVFYSCTAQAFYPEENDTWTEDALTDHGGSITWSVWTGTEAGSVAEAEISLEQDSYIYTGSGITPTVTVTLEDKTLRLDEDYIVNYTDNVNAGIATITVMGIGSYTGEISTNFTIAKAKRSVIAYAGKNSIIEKDTTDINYVSVRGDYFYASDNPSVAEVDANGVISGVSAGTAVITVQVGETENYLAANATLTIIVTHDPDMVICDNTVTDGMVRMKCQRCNEVFTATVPTSFGIFWSLNHEPYYSSYIGSNYKVGDILECYCWDDSDADLDEMEIISQDSGVITVTGNRYLNFIADGVAKVEIRPKYNPSIGRVYTFYVGSAASDSYDDKQDSMVDNSIDKQDSMVDNSVANIPASEKINLTDPKTGAKYKVLSIAGSTKTVEYTSPANKKISFVSIPAAVKIGGVNYKVTSIAKNAFKNCGALTKVTIGSNIQTIGEGSFQGCTKLKNIKIGKNVEKIGKKAFYGDKRLSTITINTSKLTSKSVGSKAFAKTYKKVKVKVPRAKLKAYKAWLVKKGISKKASIKK